MLLTRLDSMLQSCGFPSFGILKKIDGVATTKNNTALAFVMEAVGFWFQIHPVILLGLLGLSAAYPRFDGRAAQVWHRTVFT